MAKSTKNLRELYGFLLGEDLVKKLSDEQVNLISLYYGSLSKKEKNKIDDAISKGKSHDLLEMAQTLLEESKQDKKPKAKTTKVKIDTEPKVEQEKPKEKPAPSKSTQSKKTSTPKKKTSDSIEVDERTLSLLGLDDVFDMDGEQLLSLLKEKLVKISMGDKKISRDDQILLQNELKRLKTIDRKKTYTVKKTKISTNKFIPRKALTASKKQYLLPGTIDVKEPEVKIKKEKKDPLLENVIAIRKSVENILSLIGKQNKITKDGYDKERKRKEREKRDKREEGLENIKKTGIAAIKSVIAPVQDLLDKIINFLTWVILGRAVIKFLDWAQDPKNKSKLEALGNLLKTWWPAILGAFVLFTTPLGKFIRVVVGTVTKFTFSLLKNGIPALRRFLKERDKKKNKVTSDSQRKKPRGRNSKVTQGAGDKLSKPKGRISGRGGLFGTLGLLGLEMATPFLSEKVGDLYSGLKIGDYGLSNEDLLKEYQREKSNIERKTSGPLGDLMSQRTDYSRLEGLEKELGRRGIAYKGGGEIFSGVVDGSDGVRFDGAGQDTQAFPVVGGGTAVLKPGELVLNEDQQARLQRDTGIDPRSYVADARPKSVYGRMKGYSSGGMIGGVPQGPFTPLPSPGYVRPQGSFIPKPVLALPGPMPGTTVPFGYNPFKGLKGGGIVDKLKGFASGIGNLFTGQKAKATASPRRMPSWHGPAPLPDYKSKEAQALLRTIRKAEHYASTKNPYDALFGGGTAPISQMTVQEVIKMYDTKRLPNRFGGGKANYGPGSGAAGAYQFMPFTLEDLIRRGAVKPNQIMTRDLQDRLGWYLASDVRGVSLSGLKKSGLTQDMMDKMAPEWASFPYSPKGGLSYYDQPVKGSKYLNQIYQQSLPKKQGGGMVGPSWLPWNWGKLVDNQRKSNKGLGYEAKYNNITDPEMRRMMGLPPLKRQGGGLNVKENTGMNLLGATADRQLTALQPGEYVLPVDFVNRVGVSALDKLVSYFDSNSNPARINKNVNRVIPGPRRKNNSGKVNMLPAINQSSTMSKTPVQKPGSEVPQFNMICSGSLSVRAEQMAIYGIVG